MSKDLQHWRDLFEGMKGMDNKPENVQRFLQVAILCIEDLTDEKKPVEAMIQLLNQFELLDNFYNNDSS